MTIIVVIVRDRLCKVGLISHSMLLKTNQLVNFTASFFAKSCIILKLYTDLINSTYITGILICFIISISHKRLSSGNNSQHLTHLTTSSRHKLTTVWTNVLFCLDFSKHGNTLILLKKYACWHYTCFNYFFIDVNSPYKNRLYSKGIIK